MALLRDGNPEKSVAWVKPLRRALWLQGFKRQPLTTCRGWIAFWLREVHMRLNPPVPWVAILGMDGSGKSTVIEGIRQKWEELGLKSTFPHWRPECIKPGKSDGPETNPHGKKPRGSCASIAKLAFLLLDWTIGFRFKLADKRARGWFVIFDRFHLDLLADPVRYRYGAPLWLARWVFRLFPQPDAIILLDAPAEVLHARKPETTLVMAIALRGEYLQLVRKYSRSHVVNCDRPIQVVVDEVVSIITCETRAYTTGDKPIELQ